MYNVPAVCPGPADSLFTQRVFSLQSTPLLLAQHSLLLYTKQTFDHQLLCVVNSCCLYTASNMLLRRAAIYHNHPCSTHAGATEVDGQLYVTIPVKKASLGTQACMQKSPIPAAYPFSRTICSVPLQQQQHPVKALLIYLLTSDQSPAKQQWHPLMCG